MMPMRKRAFMAAITVSTLLISIVAGMQLINVAKANPNASREFYARLNPYAKSPTITLTSPSDTMNQNVTVAFTISMPSFWSQNVVGTIRYVECVLDSTQTIVQDFTSHVYNNNYSRLNYARQVGPLALGTHTLSIRVAASCTYYNSTTGEYATIDVSTSIGNSFTVGPKPAPTISAKLHEPDSPFYYGKKIYFSVYVSGPQKPYNYTWYIDDQKVDVKTSSTGSSYYHTSTLSIGIHQIYVEVTDETNLTGKTSLATFEVRPALPHVRILSPEDGKVYNTSEVAVETETWAERFTLNGTVQYETLKWLNYSIDGISYSFENMTFIKQPHRLLYNTQANATLNSLPNGLHNLTVYGETTFGSNVNSNVTFWVFEGEAIPTPLTTDPQGPLLSMPQEYLIYTIEERNGSQWAIVDGAYPIYCPNAEKVSSISMVYPVPPATTNITFNLNSSNLSWSILTEQFPNTLHHTVLGDWAMISTEFNLSSFFTLSIHYEHPVMLTNGSYQFLYDLNIESYLSSYCPNSTAFFTLKTEKPLPNFEIFKIPNDTSREEKNYATQSDGSQQILTFEVTSEFNKTLPGDVLFTFSNNETIQEVTHSTEILSSVALAAIAAVALVYFKRRKG